MGGMKLKLFIDNERKRVVFAEANRKWVEMLSCLINLPFSTVTNFLELKNEQCSFTNLNKSLNEDLGIETNYQSENRFYYLPLHEHPSLSELASSIAPQKMVYGCQSCWSFVSDEVNDSCPDCGSQMSSAIPYVDDEEEEKEEEDYCRWGGEGGLVKGRARYMVMDDLEVKPLSTTSFIALLKDFDIEDVGLLEEKDVDFDMDEVVKLMSTSLKSKKVLTDVFLKDTSDASSVKSDDEGTSDATSVKSDESDDEGTSDATSAKSDDEGYEYL